jgi:N-acetyl-anhydromuramyl-L-alanine amidase AmpD
MMGMNDTLRLPESNYYTENTQKTRVIIGNIPCNDLSFFEGWKLRHNGDYKTTCHYTIDRDGVIYNHFPTEKYSSFVGIPEIDKESISIGLLNIGWIRHDVSKIRWVDWKGLDVDIEPEKLIRKSWREYSYWYPYSNAQIESLINLLKQISDENIIEKLMNDNNTLLINKKEYWPISFRSNYLYYKTDVSPAFPFDKVISGIS